MWNQFFIPDLIQIRLVKNGLHVGTDYGSQTGI